MIIATVSSNGLNLREFPHAKAKVMTVLTYGDKLQVHKIMPNDDWQFGHVIYTRSGEDVSAAGWYNQKYVTYSEIPDHDFPHLPDLQPEKLLRKDEWPVYFCAVAVIVLILSALFLI